MGCRKAGSASLGRREDGGRMRAVQNLLYHTVINRVCTRVLVPEGEMPTRYKNIKMYN